MNRKQQLAFRRAWARLVFELNRVTTALRGQQNVVVETLLKERQKTLEDDIAEFAKLIVPDKVLS